MQPFSYQATDTTCWITSMLNGIIFCRNGKAVSSRAYDKLNSLLCDKGVYYHDPRVRKRLNAIARDVEHSENVKICFYLYDKVAEKIDNLSFHEDQKMAVVCDIHNGDHSILITNGTNGWFHCFDPYWKYVCEKQSKETKKRKYKTIPAGRIVNLKIKKAHLLSTGKEKDRRMGGTWRHLTLIRANRRHRRVRAG